MPSTSNSFETLNLSELNNSENPNHYEEIPRITPQSTPSSSKKAQKSMQSIDLKSASPSRSLKWNTQGVEVDSVQQETTTIVETTVEWSDTQHMEEDPESFDIGDLDIFGLEKSCKKKEYDKILER